MKLTETVVDVGKYFLLGHLDVADSNSQAEHLQVLHLELDGEHELVDLVLKLLASA